MKVPNSDNAPEPPVYGLPLQELLMHAWFDGFTSGASTACAQFLPDEAADARADEARRGCARIARATGAGAA